MEILNILGDHISETRGTPPLHEVAQEILCGEPGRNVTETEPVKSNAMANQVDMTHQIRRECAPEFKKELVVCHKPAQAVD